MAGDGRRRITCELWDNESAVGTLHAGRQALPTLWLVLLITFSPLVDWWTAALTGPGTIREARIKRAAGSEAAGFAILGSGGCAAGEA